MFDIECVSKWIEVHFGLSYVCFNLDCSGTLLSVSRLLVTTLRVGNSIGILCKDTYLPPLSQWTATMILPKIDQIILGKLELQFFFINLPVEIIWTSTSFYEINMVFTFNFQAAWRLHSSPPGHLCSCPSATALWRSTFAR